MIAAPPPVIYSATAIKKNEDDALTQFLANLAEEREEDRSVHRLVGKSTTLSHEAPSSARARVLSLAQKAVNDLQYYRTLPPRWDGYRGKTFDPRFINLCQAVVSQVFQYCASNEKAPAEITPGPAGDGSMDIEVVSGEKRLVLTFYPDSADVNVYKDSAQGDNERTEGIKALGLEEKLSWLFS